MLFITPDSVTFNGATLADVQSIAVDRSAEKLLEEWNDAGPYAVFADVPEQRIEITISQNLPFATQIASPVPGTSSTLAFTTSPNGADASRLIVSTTAVVTSVKHKISQGTATRTITLVAISSNGSGDPITTAEPV